MHSIVGNAPAVFCLRTRADFVFVILLLNYNLQPMCGRESTSHPRSGLPRRSRVRGRYRRRPGVRIQIHGSRYPQPGSWARISDAPSGKGTSMPVVPMQEILKDAFDRRYGVGAFNIVNDLTMDAVLSAAQETKSPVIVQVSVKTVKVMGARLLALMFQEMAGRVSIPAALHLDHCPDRKVIEDCVAAGWNSVLFDASKLTYEDNLAQTKEVVALAHAHGVAAEGELEAITGVEDGVGDEYGGPVVALDRAVAFLRETGIDSFAPAIGTAHGMYKGEPKINFERVSQIVAAEPAPLVLHGGTGLHDAVIQELIARGAVKVNISTQLKITFADSFRAYSAEHPTGYDPLKLLGAVRKNINAVAAGYMRVFGSEGKAA